MLQANVLGNGPKRKPGEEHNPEDETKLDHLHHFISLFDALQNEVTEPSYRIGSRCRSRIISHISGARDLEVKYLHNVHGEARVRRLWRELISNPMSYSSKKAQHTSPVSNGLSSAMEMSYETLDIAHVQDNIKQRVQEGIKQRPESFGATQNRSTEIRRMTRKRNNLSFFESGSDDEDELSQSLISASMHEDKAGNKDTGNHRPELPVVKGKADHEKLHSRIPVTSRDAVPIGVVSPGNPSKARKWTKVGCLGKCRYSPLFISD